MHRDLLGDKRKVQHALETQGRGRGYCLGGTTTLAQRLELDFVGQEERGGWVGHSRLRHSTDPAGRRVGER